MYEIFSWIGGACGVISTIAVMITQKSALTYIDEKAKNLATLEDTAKITRAVESVRQDLELVSHQKKEIFNEEYVILQDVWRVTWEFQASAKKLRPIMDYLPTKKEEQLAVFKERHGALSESIKEFINVVIKNRPFIPKEIFDACEKLRIEIVPLQVDFEMTFDGSSHLPDWKKIRVANELIDACIETVNDKIRIHIFGE